MKASSSKAVPLEDEKPKNLGHFIIGKTLGQGTFGKVKLGTHLLTGEKVFFISQVIRLLSKSLTKKRSRRKEILREFLGRLRF
jgi:serine/threonine protein kinase